MSFRAGARHSLAGRRGSHAVTWFTFPAVFFCLSSVATVGRIHPWAVGFHAPLTDYRRQVVGESSSGAVFSGYHVLWPEGFEGALDWPITA